MRRRGEETGREGASERLPRRSVFLNLFLSMVVFGVLIGLIFPPFAEIVLDVDEALSAYFFAMCVAAGAIVGLFNFLLFRLVVSRAIDRVAGAMRGMLASMESAERMDDGASLKLPISTRDAIGRIERSFNEMADAVARRVNLEWSTRSLLSLLSTSVELPDVAGRILRGLVDASGAMAGLIYCDTGEGFDRVADTGVDITEHVPERLSARLGPVTGAMQSGQITALTPGEGGLQWIRHSTPLGRFQPGSIVLVPLTAKGQAAGIAILACDARTLTAGQRQLLEAMRTQVAPHLQNAVLHGKIRDLAAIDDLTRILNRRFGVRRLNEEFSRSVRHGVPVSAVMFDIDHFKQFNDAQGHDAGDAVLKHVSRLTEKHVRVGDVACRYGGEEFLIIEPGVGMAESARVAERLRSVIQTSPVTWEEKALEVTASFGVATWPLVPASSAEELISAADKALYQAKESGRNRVCVHRGDTIVAGAGVAAEGA